MDIGCQLLYTCTVKLCDQLMRHVGLFCIGATRFDHELYCVGLIRNYLARSVSLFFIYFFSGRLRSPAGSGANGPIFTKISGLVDR